MKAKPKKLWWTVLLLWPDHCTDDYGKDTYRTFVMARSPVEADARARAEIRARCSDEGQDAPDAADFHLLSLAKGRVFSYDDGNGGVSDDASKNGDDGLDPDVLRRLVDWVRYKNESLRIDFENDAPYMHGMLEEIEGFLDGTPDPRQEDCACERRHRT